MGRIILGLIVILLISIIVLIIKIHKQIKNKTYQNKNMHDTYMKQLYKLSKDIEDVYNALELYPNNYNHYVPYNTCGILASDIKDRLDRTKENIRRINNYSENIDDDTSLEMAIEIYESIYNSIQPLHRYNFVMVRYDESELKLIDKLAVEIAEFSHKRYEELLDINRDTINNQIQRMREFNNLSKLKQESLEELNNGCTHKSENFVQLESKYDDN